MKRKRLKSCILLLSFLAGIHQGRVAIWQGEDPEPAIVLPYPADLLPEADRKALEAGIRIQSRQDLARFMEDFCS